MRTTLLDGEWTVRSVRGPVPDHIARSTITATVPGTIHTDLLRAGLIPEPFDGDNETLLDWIGRTVWEYSRTFVHEPGDDDRHDLICDGLDTIATIQVNGAIVGHTANQHRVYRFDLVPYLRAGVNEISIRFDSAEEYAQAQDRLHGELPHSYTDPYNYIRKSASNFGWDWGIRAVTAGIWRSIRVRHWSVAVFRDLRIVPDLEGENGRLTVTAEIDRSGSAVPVHIDVCAGGQTAITQVLPGQTRARLTLTVPEVSPWWPTGHGDQPLYDVSVRLRSDVGDLDGVDRRVGFRSVRVNTAADEAGTPFELFVNGQLVVVRGVNWIPDDAFVTRIDEARFRRRLTDAKDAHANLVRVWGGGLYEDDTFYDLCDELGLLVWQDFLFACAAYPEEEPLWSEVEAEAVGAISRLGSHPSLVVWNANNENIWGYVDWGWRPRLGGRSWGDGYYQGLLKRLVEELDGTRAYSPGSPYSFSPYVHPNDPRHGTCHIWDVWNTHDYTHYQDYSPRFVSEFGFQGPPAWTTLTRVVHDEPLDPYGPQMLVHQKARDGNLKLERGFASHFPEPHDIREWHFVTQLNQAHALSFGIERFRGLGPVNSGMIVWQLNDNWPVISWSLVDYDGNRKPAWYAVRRAYQPRTVLFRDRAEAHDLVVVNDSGSPISEELNVRRVDPAGRQLSGASIPVEVAPRERIEIGLGQLGEQLCAGEALVCDGPSLERAVAFSTSVRDQGLDPSALGLRVEPAPSGLRIVVTAQSLVRDLWLASDLVGPRCSVDSGLITLLPGESHVFVLSGIDREEVSDEVIDDAVWSANRLFRH